MIWLRSIAVFVVSVHMLAAQGPPTTNAEGAKTWIGRYEEFEEYLRTAECVSRETFRPAYAVRCTLPPGGPIARMAWRSPDLSPGFHEWYKTEIAAYELDKLLKLDMVPPSVVRQLPGGAEGSAQQWVENVYGASTNESPGEPYRAEWENQLDRMRMFDNLIGNRDRVPGSNMLRDAGWNLILLDHSRAFGVGTDLRYKMTRIDSGLWKRIEGLTQKQLDGALTKWIDESAIRAILDRRERMRAEIKLPAR